MKIKILKIISAKNTHQYVIDFIFSDNKKVTIDFYPFLNQAKNPEITKYLNPKKFKSFKVKDGEIMWGDFDLIFPLIDIYNGKIMKGDQSGSKGIAS